MKDGRRFHLRDFWLENLNNDDIEFILKQSVDPVNSEEYIGEGRINIFKALQSNSIPEIISDITSPIDGELVVRDIDIIGVAKGEKYKIYYGEGLYPSNWIEIDARDNPDGEISSSFDISNIGDGDYTLKLEVYKEGTTINSFSRIRIYKDIHEGWGKKLDSTIYSNHISDLNLDGNKEVIITSGKFVYVFDSEGEIKDGWPKEHSNGDAFASIGNLDEDTALEVVIASYEKLQIFNYDGDDLLDLDVNGVFPSHPVIDDIDGDGRNEIIVGTRRGYVFMWDLLSSYTSADSQWPMFQQNVRNNGVRIDKGTEISSVEISSFDFSCVDDTFLGSCNEKGELCVFGENLIEDETIDLESGREYLFFGYIEGGCYLNLYDLVIRDKIIPLSLTSRNKVVAQFILDGTIYGIKGDVNVKCRVNGDAKLTNKYMTEITGNLDLYEDCNYCNSCETCSDSDGGLNYYLVGTTHGKNYREGVGPNNDSCESDIALREFYCWKQWVPWSKDEQSIVISSDYICPNGCDEGMCKIPEGF